MCVHINYGKCACVFICACKFVCVHACMYIGMSLSVYTCVHPKVFSPTYCFPVYVRARTCVYVCVHVHACMRV